MTNVNQEMFLRRRSKIFIEPSSVWNEENKSLITAFARNIEKLGYVFTRSVVEAMFGLDINELKQLHDEVIKSLRKMLGAYVRYKPMYPNFPEQVASASDAELYINAFLHYLTDGQWLPEYENVIRPELFEPTYERRIGLGTKEEFFGIFTNLCSSKTSISETDKLDVAWVIRECGSEVISLLPDEIPLKENVALVSKLMMENIDKPPISKYFKTATDVLRLAAAMSDGDLSLATPTKFISFRNKDRRFLLNLLENLSVGIEEDMLRHHSQWLRLGERLHPGEYKLPKVKEAFRKLRNAPEEIKSFNAIVEAAIQKKDPAAIDLLKKRPGEMARKLDHLARNFTGTKIVSAFKEVAEKVSSPVLLQVMKHFETRNDMKDLRVFFPKGSIAKAFGLENNLTTMDSNLCADLAFTASEALGAQFKTRDPLGKVWIDPNLVNYLVPFSQRSASKSLKSLVRGSKIPVEKNIVRSFIYWKDVKNDRTDIDLSAVIYNEDWTFREYIAYFNLRGGYGGNKRYTAVHSGDIVSAPNGASEFIDIDMDSIVKYGSRYVLFSMNSFTRQSYVNLPECFFGWMNREQAGSGEIYEPKTVVDKSDVTSDTLICIPAILDCREKKMIWSDLSLKVMPYWVSTPVPRFNSGNNVATNLRGISLMGKAMTDIIKPNLYDLLMIHGMARGTIVDKKEDADVVFSAETFPFETDVIMSQYL